MREKSILSFLSMASAHPATSVWIEWSMTRSTGMRGLTASGSFPAAAMASRMLARSVTAGPPVKSCRSTLAGIQGMSASFPRGDHEAMFLTSSSDMVSPLCLSTPSSSTLME